MASFLQHVNVSVVSSGVIILPLYHADILSINESMVVLVLGLVGGMLPDLDLDSSRPTQVLFHLFSIFVPLLLLLYFSDGLPVLHMIALWLVLGFILHFMLRKILGKITTHRGVFHTIPMGILFAQIALFISQELLHQESAFSSLIAFFIFFGFISHLLLDEIYSINFSGIKTKKSFGTAFKLYDKNNLIGTLFLYIMIFIGLEYIPLNTDVLVEVFHVLKEVKIV